MTIETERSDIEEKTPKDVNSNDRTEGSIILRNPHLNEMSEDVLYHLALSTATHDLPKMFGDVKFVCVGGTAQRMATFALYVSQELDIKLPTGTRLHDISQRSQRFSMYKVGPVLCVNHGIGSPSISIMLQEVIKLLYHARAKDAIFLRIGTCGGIGLEPGSIAITSSAVDGLMRPYFELPILGRLVRRPTLLDKDIAMELKDIGDRHFPECTTVIGKTMCTDDFYEGQGRLDGAFCEYTHQEKMAYLQQLRDDGVVNIEMESLTFAAICGTAGIKAAVLCVTLVDRLKNDQVTATKATMEEWQLRVLHVAAMFIKKRLNVS